MIQITDQIRDISKRVDAALERANRSGQRVTLVAVSKRQPAAAVVAARAAGLTHFGENYLQEGLEKIAAVADDSVEWHFIGRVQSNKTRPIAEHFAWVDTIDRDRIADRLNDARPAGLPPLNVLIQVNVDAEPQKGGIDPAAVLPLAAHIASLPRLKLRGVMGMPPAGQSTEQARDSLRAVAAAARTLREAGFGVDTISMGMSSDYELAIECGSTQIRVGTSLFGPRPTGPA